jgi:hypothetical protein
MTKFIYDTRGTDFMLTVTGVGIDGLEEAEGNPDVDGYDVQVWPETAVEYRPKNSPCSENHHFERMCILRSKAKGRRIFVVEFMNMFIE